MLEMICFTTDDLLVLFFVILKNVLIYILKVELFRVLQPAGKTSPGVQEPVKSNTNTIIEHLPETKIVCISLEVVLTIISVSCSHEKCCWVADNTSVWQCMVLMTRLAGALLVNYVTLIFHCMNLCHAQAIPLAMTTAL